MIKNLQQTVLNFACDNCPWRVTERCDGPINGETYLMQNNTLVPCVDVLRRGEFFADISDRIIPVPATSHQHKINLPPFIASIKDGLILPMDFGNYTFAIPLGKILNKKGELIYKTVNIIKRRFGLPQGSKLVLIGTGKDEKIEPMWKNSDKNQIWEHIAAMGFDWVTPPCFSVWTETPRAHQIWSQDRILQAHDILAELGVPSIPFLFPVDDSDFKMTQRWLNDRPDITKIAVYGRYYRSSKDFPHFLNLMRRIQKLADRPLEFLVVGLAMADKIFSIMEEFEATIVNGKAFHRAYAGEICRPDLTYKASNAPRIDLTLYNFKQNFDYCDRHRKQSLELALA